MAASALAVPALLSLDDYLATSYRPDCDFVDGYLEERPLGEFEHNNLQAALIAWFFTRGREWGIRVLQEQRTKVGVNRVRVPDVSIVPRDTPNQAVRVTPPVICIEILSPEDRLSRTVRVLKDYLDMGVAHLWLFDPIDRDVFIFTAQGLKPFDQRRIDIPNSPIYLDLDELFRSLD